jgi:hypothetical protein
MSTIPPLAIRIAELHRGRHLNLCLTTGAARSAAPGKMFSKRNKNKPGRAFMPASLFISFLDNIDHRFTGLYFYPPHQTARPALFNRRMLD